MEFDYLHVNHTVRKKNLKVKHHYNPTSQRSRLGLSLPPFVAGLGNPGSTCQWQVGPRHGEWQREVDSPGGVTGMTKAA